MAIDADQMFAFDVQGYLHLRGAITLAELAEVAPWMGDVDKTDVKALNADNIEGMTAQLNRPVSRVFDADIRFDSPAQRQAFTEALQAAITDVIAKHTAPTTTTYGADGSGRPYRLLIACYPKKSKRGMQ